MFKPLSNIVTSVLLAIIVVACVNPPEPDQGKWQGSAKIGFSLADIHDDGLRGEAGGLVSVSYEFCLPADEQVYRDVEQIDPSLRIYPHSPGRIGCGENQSLAIGETHQAGWRMILKELSSLAYVEEIRECFFE